MPNVNAKCQMLNAKRAWSDRLWEKSCQNANAQCQMSKESWVVGCRLIARTATALAEIDCIRCDEDWVIGELFQWIAMAGGMLPSGHADL